MERQAKTMTDPGIRPKPASPFQTNKPTWMERIVAFDLAFLRMLSSWTLPKALSLPLILLVRVGDGWIWLLIAFYLWISLPMLQVQSAVIHCLLTLAISLAIYWPIKLLVRRVRPHNSSLGITAMVPPLDKFSFPSGHTMNNLAVALTVSIYLPNLFIPTLILPISMGILRILFGVHYFSDIAGGAVLGTLSYFLALAIFPYLPN
jgi:undecaprenyl-diphosphatase